MQTESSVHLGFTLSQKMSGLSGSDNCKGRTCTNLYGMRKEAALCAGTPLYEMRKRAIQGGTGILLGLCPRTKAL